jgi:hypothetical protein
MGAMVRRKRRVQDEQLARKLILFLFAAVLVLATGGAAAAEEPSLSPNVPAATGTQGSQPSVSNMEAQREEDNRLSHWMTLPPAYDPADWSSFGSSVGGNLRAGSTFNRNASASSSAAPQVGSSYLGIQTNKNVQVLQSLRPNDCGDDDECAEYTGLPRTAQPKTSATMKDLKRQFIGLSITRPLN